MLRSNEPTDFGAGYGKSQDTATYLLRLLWQGDGKGKGVPRDSQFVGMQRGLALVG